jgi:cytochrome c oxidase subunit 2
MLITLVAHAPRDYATWIVAAIKDYERAFSPETAAGRELFRSLACAGCHTLKPLTSGKFPGAPELTHVASKKSIAGGALSPVNEENLTRWLSNPPAVKPGTQMPNLNLSQTQVRDLVQFLLTQK